MLWQLAYLVLLGVVFGVLIPWPSPPDRPWNLMVRGRAFLYLLRAVASMSIAIFIAEQTRAPAGMSRFIRYLWRGTLLASVAGVLSFFSGPERSLFNLVSLGELSPNPATFGSRVSGLNFEPRSLALAAVHGTLLALLLWSHRRSASHALGFALGISALFVSRSTSGLVALAVGAITMALSDRRTRQWILGTAIGLSIAAALFLGIARGRSEAPEGVGYGPWAEMLSERVGRPERYGEPKSFFEAIVFRTEIYDAPAILFLADNLGYVLAGTGPGLVMFPASDYIPMSVYTAEFVAEGLRSPPTMGLVLEVSNAGLIGLCLWWATVRLSIRGLRSGWTREDETPNVRRVTLPLFATGAAIYLVAAGFSSSFWILLMGLGFGASRLPDPDWIEGRPYGPLGTVESALK